MNLDDDEGGVADLSGLEDPKTKEKLTILLIDPSLFAFQFFHWRDKEKALSGRPWCFENNLLVLKEINGDEQP